MKGIQASRDRGKASAMKYCFNECAVLPVTKANMLKTTLLEYNVFVVINKHTPTKVYRIGDNSSLH
jgi:hypothetical protein